jgi:transposase-like protein
VLSKELLHDLERSTTMAEDRMALLETLRKGVEPGSEEPGADDFLRRALSWLVHELMEAEVAAQIGADRYERSEDRIAQRNGVRRREWDTRVGTLDVAIPKLRTGSYFPTFLEPRRRAEQALVAVVAEAYVQGVSTRKGEALVQTLGIAGRSKSEVSRMAASLDWMRSIRTCGWMPATRRCARTAECRAWRWWWPMACGRTACARCWASM